MKRTLIVLAVVAVTLAALWRYAPDTLAPLLSGTPLRQHLNNSTPLYQWQDAEGNWQVTDRPPAEGIPYQTRQYALDANRLPPPPARE